ncbi:MAG: hypothetical protein VW270_06875 [Candidatus Poseidoniales archaeon]|jgi:hypothetical protein
MSIEVKKPHIVGYGICGPNEASRYLRATLEEFKRLCDTTIILCNNCGDEEKAMIAEYGFKTVNDTREWGKLQWAIKEDFIKTHVAKLKPDICIALDMDEVFDPTFTKEKATALLKEDFEAFYFYIINLWDDGYNPERNFWNIRAWKWKPEYGFEFPHKNVHCGLAPEWVWSRAYYTPYVLLHYGLQKKTDRLKKVERYKKYDPNARCISEQYYQSIASEVKATPFDLDKIRLVVQSEVFKTKQLPKKPAVLAKSKEKIAYVRNGAGRVYPVNVLLTPLEEVTKRPGMEFIGWHDEVEKELEDLLND